MLSTQNLIRAALGAITGLVVLMAFQNCGPTFVTDAQGDIKVSEMGSDSPAQVSPFISRQRIPGSIPAATKSTTGLEPTRWRTVEPAPEVIIATGPVADKPLNYNRDRTGPGGVDGSGSGGSPARQ